MSVGHAQVKELTPSTQTPPFIHGLLTHSLMSGEGEENLITIERTKFTRTREQGNMSQR